MSTKFFIGGNKFYDTEEEATADLLSFQMIHKIPHDAFVVVKIRKEESKALPEQKTFKPAAKFH